MNTRVKKLSLAVYWHMHQPVYELEGTYLMPWVRLHAVKDYLDMVLILEKFPKLKLNFNLVPALLDSILDYTENGYHDIHSELTVSDSETLTDEEKAFILNNFFSSKFETMIYRSETYKNLYQKRFAKDAADINDFSAQEISDLMALFNLVWIDPTHFDRYPRLKDLWAKQTGYTKEDRIEIIDIQKQIIREIIPTYKKYIQTGRIELTTSPYYHAILPILIDIKSSTKSVITTEGLPQNLGMLDDAKLQIRSALDRIEEVFGVRPKGMWPPELCLGTKTLNLLAKEGIEWTISDEGVLANSINFDFVRDFKGNLNDPYHLLKVYNYETSGINVIFRDRSIPNLINFEYAGINPKMAAGDLFEKIYSGSWIDKTFRYWIGESEKNKAWAYLKNTKDDFERFVKEDPKNTNIKYAKREILIAEGSDWFWWYGEPNNSGQDYVFDYMFRERLKNVYIIFGRQYPEYLDKTLITSVEVPFRHPKRKISPRIDGLSSSYDDWYNAGTLTKVLEK